MGFHDAFTMPLARVALLAGLVLTAGLSGAQALDCPPPPAPDQSGVLAETPDHLAAMTKLLASGAAEADIANIVAQVRQWRPNAPAAVLTNYLIALYCPSVQANSNLSEAEKTAKVNAFSSRVVQSLY